MKGVTFENETKDQFLINYSFRQRLTIKWGGSASGSATGGVIAANGENQFTPWEQRDYLLGPKNTGPNALNESRKRFGQHRKKHFRVDRIVDLTTQEIWSSYSPGEGHFAMTKDSKGVTLVGCKHHSGTEIAYQRARQPSPPPVVPAPAVPPATAPADPLTREEKVLVLVAKAFRWAGLPVETVHKERTDRV